MGACIRRCIANGAQRQIDKNTRQIEKLRKSQRTYNDIAFRNRTFAELSKLPEERATWLRSSNMARDRAVNIANMIAKLRETNLMLESATVTGQVLHTMRQTVAVLNLHRVDADDAHLVVDDLRQLSDDVNEAQSAFATQTYDVDDGEIDALCGCEYDFIPTQVVNVQHVADPTPPKPQAVATAS